MTFDASAMVNMDNMQAQIAQLRQENERLREALEYISFSSHGCPVVIDGVDVPVRWQEEIRKQLRHLGNAAEQALQKGK